jgi:hypothetical protein
MRLHEADVVAHDKDDVGQTDRGGWYAPQRLRQRGQDTCDDTSGERPLNLI